MERALALAIATVAAGVAAASAATVPVIRTSGAGPLMVTGTGFAPRERVVVVATNATRTRKVSVVTSPTGRFRVTLTIPARACETSYPIRAIGDAGSRARTRAVGRPCIPPPVE